MTKETDEAAATASAKPARERQNGFTKPAEGTTTRLVWDIADEISAAQGRPAMRNEVFDEFTKRLGKDASAGTCGTQYSRWSGFHSVGPVLKKMRAEAKAAADKEKADAKAEKAAERAEAKAAKDKAAAEKKEAAEKAKADKAAAAKAKQDEKDRVASEKAKAAAAKAKK